MSDMLNVLSRLPWGMICLALSVTSVATVAGVVSGTLPLEALLFPVVKNSPLALIYGRRVLRRKA